MQAFTTEQGIVIPIDRPNIDTDAIIPKQFLKSIQRSGFGVNLFDEWRYTDRGEPGQDCQHRPLNKTFVLNQARYQGGSILLARDNFGCGSSREHAAWAIADYGIRVIIAPSFADIFLSNSGKNGILAIELATDIVDVLFQQVAQQIGYRLTIDLPKQMITMPDETVITFDIDPFKKVSLINGFDDIALTQQHQSDITAYEKQRSKITPWLF